MDTEALREYFRIHKKLPGVSDEDAHFALYRMLIVHYEGKGDGAVLEEYKETAAWQFEDDMTIALIRAGLVPDI